MTGCVHLIVIHCLRWKFSHPKGQGREKFLSKWRNLKQITFLYYLFKCKRLAYLKKIDGFIRKVFFKYANYVPLAESGEWVILGRIVGKTLTSSKEWELVNGTGVGGEYASGEEKEVSGKYRSSGGREVFFLCPKRPNLNPPKGEKTFSLSSLREELNWDLLFGVCFI